nr:glycosyltransferase family 2 protein [uncultured Cohaesibacter sp.]
MLHCRYYLQLHSTKKRVFLNVRIRITASTKVRFVRRKQRRAYWGHNAIVRVHAFAGSCGLPTLRRTPPFGGHILSHDCVEATLLARSGWGVQDDETITGSHEEGPENIIEYAKRDRRWCQGQLQQARVIPAPGLHPWSRFTLPNGIMTYVSSLLWFLFIALRSQMTSPTNRRIPHL